MAGVFGKATGPARGKWTSHHMGDLDKGILVGSLIIGSQFPTAVGAAMTFKLKKTDQVCLCFFGDGASNRGDFHEGLNMAAILNLPVIFICENNGYALYTPVEQNMRIKDIAVRAQGLRDAGGHDRRERCPRGPPNGAGGRRRGRGKAAARPDRMQDLPAAPPLREVPGDPPDRRSSTAAGSAAPSTGIRRTLVGRGVLDAATDEKILRECEEEIDQAVKFADESPFPDPGELCEDVYADGTVRGGRLCVS